MHDEAMDVDGMMRSYRMQQVSSEPAGEMRWAQSVTWDWDYHYYTWRSWGPRLWHIERWVSSQFIMGHPSCVSRFGGSHPGLVWVSIGSQLSRGWALTRYSEQAFLSFRQTLWRWRFYEVFRGPSGGSYVCSYTLLPQLNLSPARPRGLGWVSM